MDWPARLIAAAISESGSMVWSGVAHAFFGSFGKSKASPFRGCAKYEVAMLPICNCGPRTTTRSTAAKATKGPTSPSRNALFGSSTCLVSSAMMSAADFCRMPRPSSLSGSWLSGSRIARRTLTPFSKPVTLICSVGTPTASAMALWNLVLKTSSVCNFTTSNVRSSSVSTAVTSLRPPGGCTPAIFFMAVFMSLESKLWNIITASGSGGTSRNAVSEACFSKSGMPPFARFPAKACSAKVALLSSSKPAGSPHSS
mmetsp:Transcript_43129/g.69691  ORF Transcript_43129/g.69691 Transcript_43129/m.69691 type:complete len:256 (+) Transcript_43129:3149-3916(+)